jgi:ribose transport system permease protein
MTPPRAKRAPSATRAAAAPLLFAVSALALVLVLGTAFSAEGAFFNSYTHSSTLGQLAPFAILACGMTIVILTGGIDLSVGSIVAFSGVITATLITRSGWPDWLALAAGIAAGAACGLISGSMIAFLRLQPFIATLAMMAFARGLAKRLSENTKILMLSPPPMLEALDRQLVIGKSVLLPHGFLLPVGVPLALSCIAATYVLLRLLPIGVAIYAIGGNHEAARYAGIPVRRTKIMAYALCGALAGLAGILISAREHQANPDGGVGYELTAIAMVVVGGTSLAGGRGGILLTVLGALTIGYLQKILDINGMEPDQQLMITGGIIALAVLVQGVRRR